MVCCGWTVSPPLTISKGMIAIWTWVNICFSGHCLIQSVKTSIGWGGINYCPTIRNWDRQISLRLQNIEDSHRHNVLLSDKMLIWETHMSWLTLLRLYIPLLHSNLRASWLWVLEHGGWDLQKGRKLLFSQSRARTSKVKVFSDAIVSHVHHRQMTKHLRSSEEE